MITTIVFQVRARNQARVGAVLVSSIEGLAWAVREMPVSRIHSHFDVEDEVKVVVEGNLRVE